MYGDLSCARRSARRPLRLENCAWQRAAAGLLALSVSVNAGLYGLLGHEEARHTREADGLRAELQLAKQVRDHAVRELGAMALDAARERQARAEQAAAFGAVGAWEYIGECTVTAYCPCVECCGRWADGVTATGLPAGPGIVAVDKSVIPLGSTVIIDGQRYLAADTGGAIKGNKIDICMGSHSAASDFGVQNADVWIVPKEDK